VPLKVIRRPAEGLGGFTKRTDRHIAFSAEESSHLTSVMVVVDRQPTPAVAVPLADRTDPTLKIQDLPVVIRRDAE
jgi:hypothetical protein